MKSYEVTARVASFGPGEILKLTPEQAATRMHNLKKLKTKDTYEVVNRIEFIAGEVIGMKSAPAPAQTATLTEYVPQEKKPAPARGKAAAAITARRDDLLEKAKGQGDEFADTLSDAFGFTEMALNDDDLKAASETLDDIEKALAEHAEGDDTGDMDPGNEGGE